MDTKKKPTKEDIEYAKKRLAEAKQNAAKYDEQAIMEKKERLLEEKNKPYIPPKDRKKNIAPATALEKSSFEDIKIRSSSSDLPIPGKQDQQRNREVVYRPSSSEFHS